MNELSEKKIAFIVIIAFFGLLIMFFCFSALFSAIGVTAAYNAQLSQKAELVMNTKNPSKMTIIIDAGHGGEDSGASDNGYYEKVLNLELSKKLCEMLKISGYDVLMTRTDDNLLYEQGQENKKKFYDLSNRLKIAEQYEEAIFISIHMNKFPISRFKGLQVFYSSNNEESSKLAELIQTSTKEIMPDNLRKTKEGSNISYILERIKIPAVLVECGFLSNPEEAENLANEEYQKKLAFLIYCGVVQYLGGLNEG